MKNEPESPAVVAYVADLMFGSKLSAMARTAGVKLRTVRNAKAVEESSSAALIVDLELPDSIATATRWIAATGRPALGFGSHVDAAQLRAARAAGLNPVLTRSQLAQNLPAFLAMIAQQTGDAK